MFGVTLAWADVGVLFAGFLLVLLIMLRRCGGESIQKSASSDRMRGYRLVYADQKKDGANEDFGKLLYSAEYELQGRPDYIFKWRFGERFVPVELKSGEIGEDDAPHEGDLLQLGVYFLIVEDVYKSRPKFGRLIYKDYMFTVKNTRALRRDVQKTTKQMRDMLSIGVAKPKNSFANCRFCICNGTVCPYSDTGIVGGKENESSSGEE